MKVAEDLRRAVLQAGIEGRLTGGRCEGWRFVRLGDVTYNHGQKKPDCDFYYIDVGSIDNKKCQLGDSDIVISPEKASSRARKIIKQDDVIYALIRPYLHNICIVNRSYSKEVIASTAFAVMHCREEILTRYLYYVLLSPMFDKYANAPDKSRGVAYPAIGERDFLNGIIPLPPLNEQHRIVSRLDSILPRIAELESAENELEALERKFPGDMRDSLLQAAIQGELTGGTENWRWVRLGDVISLISGTDLPSDQHNTVGNGTPYITGASNIVDGSLIINRWTTTPKRIAKRGDILLTCKGTIGANCILELEEAHIARQIMAIRVTAADVKYVHYYLQHYVDTLKKQAKSMIPGIERKNVTEAIIPLPPIEQQHKIVSRLNELLPLCDSLENLKLNAESNYPQRQNTLRNI